MEDLGFKTTKPIVLNFKLNYYSNLIANKTQYYYGPSLNNIYTHISPAPSESYNHKALSYRLEVRVLESYSQRYW